MSGPCGQIEGRTRLHLTFNHDVKHLLVVAINTQGVVQVGVSIHGERSRRIVRVVIRLDELHTQTLGIIGIPSRLRAVHVVLSPSAVSSHLEHHLLQRTGQSLPVGIFLHLDRSVSCISFIQL